jgi:probable rRNA maturation factor
VNRTSARKCKNQVAVSNQDRCTAIQISKAAALAEKTLSILKYQNTFLSLTFVSDQRIRTLNRRFLKHDWSTDVLAFSFVSSYPRFNTNLSLRKHQTNLPLRYLGEVVVSPAAAKRYSKKNSLDWKVELARYVCHGILHLSGMNDRTKIQKKRMRNRENKLLWKMKRLVERLASDGNS